MELLFECRRNPFSDVIWEGCNQRCTTNDVKCLIHTTFMTLVRSIFFHNFRYFQNNLYLFLVQDESNSLPSLCLHATISPALSKEHTRIQQDAEFHKDKGYVVAIH